MGKPSTFMPRKRVLFLPADSLPPGLTRSYWLAFALARHFTVYYLRWTDPRTAGIERRGSSRLDSPKAFLKSIAGWPRTESTPLDQDRTLELVRAPVALNASIIRLVGDLKARRWARAFNTPMVAMLATKFDVDAVFHSDGFYYFPESLGGRLPVFADVQDDFDESDDQTQIAEYAYGKVNFGRSRANFAISTAVAKRFSSVMAAPFEVVPNGVWLASYKANADSTVAALRARLGLAGKFVISYIGTASHLDCRFLLELADALARDMPDAMLMVVGPEIARRKNVVTAGFVSPQHVHSYYQASDLGMCPAPRPESRFIYHSVPLKVVQYGAARKFVLSVPNHWLEENSFPNVTLAPPDVATWVSHISALRAMRWNAQWDRIWEHFDWDTVVEPVVASVRAAV